MRASGDLLARVRCARKADPSRADATQVAVRVLARLAILEAAPAMALTPPLRAWSARRGGEAAAAALVAVALVSWGALDAGTARTISVSTVPGADVRAQGRAAASWCARARAAVAGDTLERQRLIHGGVPARGALLSLAAAAGADAVGALDLLGAAGGARGTAEMARVARLVVTADLAAPAIGLLARDLGTDGARHLGLLLVAQPHLEVPLVAALETVAASGRRRSAFEGLLAGARAGRDGAAAAAVEVGGAERLERLLAVLPGRGAPAPALVEALRRAPATTRARLAHLAGTGDGRVLALAAAADAPGVVARLAAEALAEDPARALHAVRLLAGRDDLEAHVALARALDGAAQDRARTALQRLGPDAVAGLVAHARGAGRHAAAALRALAATGAVEALLGIARESRLAPDVLRALAEARGEAVDGALAQLAARPALREGALQILAQRVRRGDVQAGAVLLDLARRGHARRVIRLLEDAGSPGHTVLQCAAADPILRLRVREALHGSGPGSEAPRRPARDPHRPRSI